MENSTTPVERFQNEELIPYLESKLTPLFASSPSISLLEVGCGTGALASLLQQKYKDKIKYKAIDPNPEVIAKAKQRGVEGAEACKLEDLNDRELFDVVLFTLSFHHLPSQKEAAETAFRLLKPGGLFIADELGRNLMDLPTATFLYPKMDALEDAGKFPTPASWWHLAPEGKKQDFWFRWTSKFMHERPKDGSHAHHEAHGHSHGHDHAHAHAHAHAQGHAHGQSDAHKYGMGPHHYLPTTTEMETDIRAFFPNLEITRNAHFYRLVCQRFDNTNEGEDIVRQFKKEEDEAIARKEITPIGIRYFAKKPENK
jgi:SAM-dependent methyltransferase